MLYEVITENRMLRNLFEKIFSKHFQCFPNVLFHSINGDIQDLADLFVAFFFISAEQKSLLADRRELINGSFDALGRFPGCILNIRAV